MGSRGVIHRKHSFSLTHVPIYYIIFIMTHVIAVFRPAMFAVAVFLACVTAPVLAKSFDSGALSFSDTAPKRPPSKYLYEQYIEYGTYYLNEGLYQQAKDEFWKAIELFPDNPDAYVNVAIVHINQKEYDNALRLLAKAEQLAPPEYYQSEILLYNFGLAYFYNEDYKKAIDYLGRALKVYPDFSQALFYLGLAYDKTGDSVNAFLNLFQARYLFEKEGLRDLQSQSEDLLKAVSQRPGLDTVDLAQRFYGKGKDALEVENDLEKAAYLFQESLFLNPQYTDVYYQLALLYSRKNAPHNAIAYLARIIEVDPTNVNAYMSLGYAYRDMHKFKQALSYFEKALELDKENATILYDIGVTYRQAGQNNSADKFFALAKKKALAAKNLFLLEKIRRSQQERQQELKEPRKPTPAAKQLLPKEPKQPPYPYYSLPGNQGNFNKGYFIPQKEQD